MKIDKVADGVVALVLATRLLESHSFRSKTLISKLYPQRGETDLLRARFELSIQCNVYCVIFCNKKIKATSIYSRHHFVDHDILLIK